MKISVKHDIDKALGFLRYLRVDQVPFATSVALNDTAFQVRKQIVEKTYPRAFTVRNQYFPASAFRVSRSTKRYLRAMVFDRLGRDLFKLHAQGGTKRPRRGRNLAIPVNEKRLPSGRIRKNDMPRRIKNSFVTDLRGYGPAVFQRYGKGRIRMRYVLEPKVKINKTFRMNEDAMMIVRREFEKNFIRAFNKAVATAR